MTTQADITSIICELTQDNARIPDYVRAVESLLNDREALLKLIPACKAHGETCSAHAKEWLCEQRSRALSLWDEGV